MRTNDILIALHALEEAPWADLKGKPLNPRGLATRLRQYGISRRKVRFGQETAWGYVRSDFADAWTRYLIPEAPESGTSGTSGIDTPEAAATADPNVPDRVPDCADVPDSELQRERRRARESANVPDVPDVPDLSAYGRSYLAGAADGADCNRVTDVTDPGPAYERCAVCDGNVVDRLEEDGLVGHPSCIIAARSWPEAARATLRRCAKHSK
jgi:hypothetical protein